MVRTQSTVADLINSLAREAEGIIGELANTAAYVAEDIADGCRRVAGRLPDPPTAEEWDRLLERLKRESDELRLQIHLGSMELQKQWEQLERQRRELLRRTRPARKEAARAAKDVGIAAQQLADEILKGYERIRRTL